MIKIDIIGRGNVATHLARAFEGKADAILVNPHTLGEHREDSDLRLISVSDDAIAKVIAKLPAFKGITAHTSGSTPLSEFTTMPGSTGVFYPLQTFSKDVELDYSAIPFFIEGSDERTESFLCDVASMISRSVRKADSAQRRQLHVASVLSCNFVNHMWALAQDHLERSGLSFKDMLPLIHETVRKAECNNPKDVQTGPAVRHDDKVVEAHMKELDYSPAAAAVYGTVSVSIMEMYKEK